MADSKLKSLDEQLAAANQATQDVLTEHSVSQGAYDKDVKESKQNDPSVKVEENKEDTIEYFESLRDERLAKAAKDLKKS